METINHCGSSLNSCWIGQGTTIGLWSTMQPSYAGSSKNGRSPGPPAAERKGHGGIRHAPEFARTNLEVSNCATPNTCINKCKYITYTKGFFLQYLRKWEAAKDKLLKPQIWLRNHIVLKKTLIHGCPEIPPWYPRKCKNLPANCGVTSSLYLC